MSSSAETSEGRKVTGADVRLGDALSDALDDDVVGGR